MFYAVVIAFTIGVAVSTIFDIALATIVWLVSLGVVMVAITRRHEGVMPSRYLLLLAAVLLALSFGIVRTEWHKEQYAYSQFDSQVGQEVVFSGVITREPDVRERSTHLYVETGKETVLVTIDRHTPAQYGDEILVRGEVERPESFTTDLGRTFNYSGYLLARDVTHIVRYANITTLSQDNGNPVVAVLLQTKRKLMTGIESVIPEPQAGLAEGLLLGVKQALGDQLETAFRHSGIIHIVVLSGYNVMLVVAFFRFFMRPLPRLWQLIIGLIAIVSFALLVGLSATVVRATIMAGLVLIAGTFSRTYDVLRALFFAGFVMIAINPYILLYDIGFQLSFMATLGLILIAPRLETALVEGKWFGVKEFFLATVATQIAVLPLLLYHIGEVSLVAVVVNILVLPVVPFAMLGAFVTGVLALTVPLVSFPAGYVTSLLLSFILVVATWFAGVPFATVTVSEFSPWWILIAYAAMSGGYLLHKKLSDRDDVSLSDWEIVEEQETDGAAPNGAAPKDGLPIYFR